MNYEGGGVRDYLATHEVASANLEGLIFENLEKRELKPGGTMADMSAMVMNGAVADKRVGTAIMLRVMAGDKFKAEVAAYYNDGDYNPDEEKVPAESMASSLLGALGGGLTEIGNEVGGVEFMNSMLGSDNFISGYNSLKESMTDPGQPRAYLNYVLFDEDMHIIQDQSGALQVNNDCAGNWAELQMQNDIVVGKNGYLVAYMSNESNMDIAMDNFLITYSRGNLLEEQHYYPHGLVVKDGTNNPVKNRYLYQGKEMQDEAGMQLYDFHARQYDPQVGRFWGIDPMDEFPSGYTGMGNNPANFTDPTGMYISGMSQNGTREGESSPQQNPFGEFAACNGRSLMDDFRWKGMVALLSGHGTSPSGNGSKTSAQGLSAKSSYSFPLSEATFNKFKRVYDIYLESEQNALDATTLRQRVTSLLTLANGFKEIEVPITNAPPKAADGQEIGMADDGDGYQFVLWHRESEMARFADGFTYHNGRFPSIAISQRVIRYDDVSFAGVVGHERIHAMHSLIWRSSAYDKTASERVALGWEAHYYYSRGAVLKAYQTYNLQRLYVPAKNTNFTRYNRALDVNP